MAYSVWQHFITDGGEQIVASALISVYFESSGLPAPIYDGPSGSTTGNTTISDITGLARFYAPFGTYRIVASKGSFSATFRDVQLGNMSAVDDAPIDSVIYGRMNGNWEPVAASGLIYEAVKAISVGTGGDYADMQSAMTAINSGYTGQLIVATLLDDLAGPAAIFFTNYAALEINLNGKDILTGVAIISGGTKFLALSGSGSISATGINIYNNVTPFVGSPASLTLNQNPTFTNCEADVISFTKGTSDQVILNGDCNFTTTNLVGIAGIYSAQGTNRLGDVDVTLNANVSDLFISQGGGSLEITSLDISGAYTITNLYAVINGLLFAPTPNLTGGAVVTNIVVPYDEYLGEIYSPSNQVITRDYIRYNSAQSLTDSQRSQARSNIVPEYLWTTKPSPDYGRRITIVGINTAGDIEVPFDVIGDGEHYRPVSLYLGNSIISYVFRDNVYVATGEGYSAIITGTGATVGVPSSGIPAGAIWPGYAEATTGTTSTGRAGFGQGIATAATLSPMYNVSEGDLETLHSIAITTLSTGTERFSTPIGFRDSSNRANITNGAYFTYTDNENGGKWLCNTIAGGSAATPVDSGVTVAVNTAYKLVVKLSTTQARFYINDVLVTTMTTNIPSGSSQRTASMCMIEKTVGTTARTMLMDRHSAIQFLINPRT